MNSDHVLQRYSMSPVAQCRGPWSRGEGIPERIHDDHALGRDGHLPVVQVPSVGIATDGRVEFGVLKHDHGVPSAQLQHGLQFALPAEAATFTPAASLPVRVTPATRGVADAALDLVVFEVGGVAWPLIRAPCSCICGLSGKKWRGNLAIHCRLRTRRPGQSSAHRVARECQNAISRLDRKFLHQLNPSW